MSKCANCGAELVEGMETFCAACGSPASEADHASPASAGAAPEGAAPLTDGAAPGVQSVPPTVQAVSPASRVPAIGLPANLNGFRFQGRQPWGGRLAEWLIITLVVLAAIGVGVYYLVQALAG